MENVLSVLLFLTFGLVAVLLWHVRRLADRQRSTLRDAAEDRSALLRDIASFLEASRRSSDAVLDSVAVAIRAADSAFDTLLAFVPVESEFQCTYASGVRSDHYRGMRFRRDDERSPVAQAALASHRIISGADVQLLPTDRRAIAIPILDGDRLQTVWYLSSPKPGAGEFAERLSAIAYLAGAPYGLAVEREADRANATYDALTGLLTPRAFRLRLRDEVERARRQPNAAFTLWFIDTDRFKDVNDTFGHAEGDRVLQAMGDILRAHTVPELDVVARNGGDEFCALVFERKGAAIERAARLCDAVRHHDFGVALPITASVGVATFPYDAKTSSDLLEAADAAMYHSKRQGRDRASYVSDGTSFAVYRTTDG